MGNANRHIIMFIDNFSGHTIKYKPKNIQLEFFAPNLTSFVQPCDAGIIRCLKAHYRRAQCLRAIDLDEAEERDIYKLDLLEAMLMIQDAWTNVTAETIKHCWDHTGIQHHSPSSPTPESTALTKSGWEIIREFAVSSTMTLPQAEEKLKATLAGSYNDSDWRPALNCVLEAENDELKALEAIEKLTQSPPQTLVIPVATAEPSATTQSAALPTLVPSPQLAELEKALTESVTELKNRKRIVGTPLTLEEMLNPVEEQEVGDSPYRFEGGDDDIIATVQREQDLQAGRIIEVDELEDDEDPEAGQELTTAEVMQLCQQMESLCMKYGAFSSSLQLSRDIRKYRIHLTKEQTKKSTQSRLDQYSGFWEQ